MSLPDSLLLESLSHSLGELVDTKKPKRLKVVKVAPKDQSEDEVPVATENTNDQDLIWASADRHIGVGKFLNESAGFMPNKVQWEFRQLTYKQIKKKKIFRSEWFDASTNPRNKCPRVTDGMWEKWVKDDPRFVGWFYSEMPDVAPVSAEEYRMMDTMFWRGLRDSMVEGEEWAYKQYAGIRFKDRPAVERSDTDMRELREYLSESAGAKWALPPGDA